MKLITKKLTAIFILIFISTFIFANNSKNIEGPILSGTEKGLYKYSIEENALIPIWTEGFVKKIIKSGETYFFLTQEGILKSEDLENFVKLNNGLPVNVIKKNKDGKNQFVTQQKALKDLAINAENPLIMVTATKDAVYLTRNGGESWKSIGLNARTSGVKSLAVLTEPLLDENGNQYGTEIVVFVSHAIYGFSYYRADTAHPAWYDMEKGFENLPNVTLTEEVASMLPVKNEETGFYDLYLGTSFIPRIYKLDWKNRKVEIIWSDGTKNATQDSLVKIGKDFVFLGTEGFKAVNPELKAETRLPLIVNSWKKVASLSKDTLCLYIPDNNVCLTELWLLKTKSQGNKYYETAKTIKGIYVPANHITDNRINRYVEIIKKNKLNAIVVDMKDDAGLLRFNPKTPLVKELGSKSQYAVDLEDFVQKMKAEDIKLIARIVVFKDKNLYNYGKNKYAVWDSETNEPWLGIRKETEVKDENGNVTGIEKEYYDEWWVDPYCEVVWQYNVAIAQELIERGFDEVQFDYIRFPTDGRNILKTQYRYYEKGMDMESALISFLSYARENIDAPIGIDIYGSNGWYRSSARTGQDVELMSDYVDVICPMFYPSHFDQNYLDYEPAEERPYRIYNFGSYRNYIIGRNKIVVRPWVQAFFLRVRYDVKYYNSDYVKREILGIQNSTNDGYLYWNNIGRYDDICPDDQLEIIKTEENN